jgi:hypothetical protein
MPDDLGSLFTISVYVDAMLGLLLLYIWAQNTGIKAVAWWGSAHLLRAGSVALFEMSGRLPDAITIDAVNVLLLTSFALTWTGARIFGGRDISLVFLVEGSIIWLIACQTPGIAESAPARALLSAGIAAAYTWFTGAELWRNNGGLVSRLPAAFMLWAQGVLFLMDIRPVVGAHCGRRATIWQRLADRPEFPDAAVHDCNRTSARRIGERTCRLPAEYGATS